MSSSTQSCFDPTLKLSSIPSKQIRHTNHEQPKSVETLYQLRSLRTSHLPSGNLKRLPKSLTDLSSDTEDSKYHLSGDLIIPDGPLTLLQSDSEKDTEDSTVSSSIESALISSNGAYSTLTTTTTDLNHSSSSQSAQSFGQQVKSSEIIVRPRIDDREHDLLQLGCFESEVEDEDEERGEETGRGGTLKLKIIKPQQPLDLLILSSRDQQHPQSRHWAHHWEKKMRPGVCDLFDSTYTIKRHNSEEDDLKNSRCVDDPVRDLLQEPLALSSQLTKKANQETLRLKPNSLVSLTGSDLDFLEDDEQVDLKKCSSILSSSSSLSSSNQKRPTRLEEDDINKGFFDDIEFPTKFGIPNSLHPASTPSNPSSLPSSKLHKPIDQAQAGLYRDKDIVLTEEDEKDQKDQKANSKEDIRTSRGKSKVRLESEFGSDE
ncbi:hypothetical protein BY996DRAFT_6436789 [Phakopsora pachyrhizi]|nr:hypothetical protein BY996DRAFT_6436789 [Phakopsora pachyrhizi]